VEEAQLRIEPNFLCFGDLIIGQVSQRILRLTNCTTIAPMYLEYVPNGNARCYPNYIRLKPKSSMEILVKVHAKENSNY